MDFVSSYIPNTPTKFTPKGNGLKFDDLPRPYEPCTPEQMEMLRNGNYREVREQRKCLEKRPSTVQFIAPLSEDGDSLQSIKLTPTNNKAKQKQSTDEDSVVGTEPRAPAAVVQNESKPRQERPVKEKKKIFGFRFLKGPSN